MLKTRLPQEPDKQKDLVQATRAFSYIQPEIYYSCNQKTKDCKVPRLVPLKPQGLILC